MSDQKTKPNDVYRLGKKPPYDQQMEINLIKVMINHPEKCTKILRILQPEVFYFRGLQFIAKAVKNLFDGKLAIDLLLVQDELRRMKSLHTVADEFPLIDFSAIEKVSPIAANPDMYYFITYRNYVRRQIIEQCVKYEEMSYDDAHQPYILLDEMIEKYKTLIKYKDLFTKQSKTTKNVASSVMEEIIMASSGEIKTVYRTGWEKTDKLLNIGPGIILMAGATGAGKTTYCTNLVKKLLANNDEVSVNWRCLDHDTSKNIIRKMITEETLITDQELMHKSGSISELKMKSVVAANEKIKNYDIEFDDGLAHIKDIKDHFIAFCEKRPKRFNILVIDNIMRVLDNKNGTNLAIDDYIAGMISDASKETAGYNSLIIYLHHFTKEQGSSLNLDSGYMPTTDHIRGSGRFTDVPEQILLFNRPALYPKLMLEYKDKQELLSRIFIMHCAKNSLGKLGFVHYFCNLDYAKFVEI